MFFNKLFKLRKILIMNYKTQILNYSTNISSILENRKVGEFINIKGWIKSLRKQKEQIFIDINDGSTIKKLQVIVSKNIIPKNITTGASISVSGIIQKSPKDQIELNAETIKIYKDCIFSEGYPFVPKKHYNSDYIRQYLHFRPKTNIFSSLLRLRSNTNLHLHNYLTNQDYINIQTGILTSNDCEGAGEIFKVIPDNENLIKSMIKNGQSLNEVFFNKKTFLTVSGQFHLEAAVHGLSKVYTLGPIFRAENSKSRLHLTEFYMLEVEIAFLDNIEDLLLSVEALIKNITKMILNTNEEDITVCKGENYTGFNWLDKKFPILTYEEAGIILYNNGIDFNPQNGLSKEHELFLVKHCGNIPIFIIKFPKDIKPFYMKQCTEDNTKVLALDLLVPGVGELVGGSLREDNFNILKEKLPKDSDQLDWYLDLRKFGGVPTGGYGLGFERYLMFLTGIMNIKDVIPFPRWPHNCSL